MEQDGAFFRIRRLYNHTKTACGPLSGSYQVYIFPLIGTRVHAGLVF